MSVECVYYKEDQSCLIRSQARCEDCKTVLRMRDVDFLARWVDPLFICDRSRKHTDALHNLLAGGSAFLLGGGPSANDLPLEQLSRRGIFTLAVNNAAGHPRVRPQAFVCSDPPRKFSHSIWLDPGVMKFVPTPKMCGRRAKMRMKANGEFKNVDRDITSCPNVWGFQRWSWFTPDDKFFLTEGACWGNHATGAKETGQPKTVCTMLLALRLLKYLGARTIYLIGVDFKMSPDRGYSFSQRRDEGASKSNMAQFVVVNDWLCQMRKNGTFERFGLEVYNTNRNSGLRAFDYVSFEKAIIEAAGLCEEIPDLAGWYEK